MPFVRPTYDEITARLWESASNTFGNLPNINSSRFGMFIKAVAKQMDEQWVEIEKIYNDSHISTMSSTALDNFGLLLGVPRKQSSQATTLGSPRSIRFTNSGVSTITIPSGTRVFNKDKPQLAFFTVEGLTLTSGQSSEVHATAANDGANYNVGIGEINSHNVNNVSVTVYNILPVGGGSYTESDDQYRERIVQEFKRRKILTKANVVALMRSVPGVRDAILINLARGNGTFDVVIIPETLNNAATILADCSDLLERNATAGVFTTVKLPKFRQLDIKINITFASTTAVDLKEQIRESIRQKIRSRVDNLPVETGLGEGTLYLTQLKSASVLSDPTVLSVVMSVGLDGQSLSPEGILTLNIGDRIILRSLEVL